MTSRYIYCTDKEDQKFPWKTENIPSEEKKAIKEKIDSIYGDGEMVSFVVSPFLCKDENWYLLGHL
jgi:hypothetical protein